MKRIGFPWRGHAWPVSGALLLTGVLAGLVWWAVAPAPLASPSRLAVSSRVASPSPTPGAGEAVVRAAAVTFVNAMVASGPTGDYRPVGRLVVPGRAVGDDEVVLAHDGHRTAVIRSLDFVASSWRIAVSNAAASASFQFRAIGHNADWPSLEPREADHETDLVSMRLTFQRVRGQWLVATME